MSAPGGPLLKHVRPETIRVINAASNSSPKSPVSFSPGDVVPPHYYSIVAPKARRIWISCHKKTFATLSARKQTSPDATVTAPDRMPYRAGAFRYAPRIAKLL